MRNPLHQRTTSGFALSIATGLAMESLFMPRQEVYDPGRTSPPRIVLSAYQGLWVNVLTLIRNAYESVDRALIPEITPLHMAEVIQQEIELIQDLLKNEGNGAVQPTFYFNDYQDLVPAAKLYYSFREDTTAIQKQARYVFETAKKILIREIPEIKTFKLYVKTLGGAGLMFTHIPADLLSYRNFGKLDLLESHTGKVKSRLEWGSKYYPVPETDMKQLPFNRQLLCCFGDRVLLSPMPIRARREIIELAKERRWNPSTSPEKVSGDLMKLKDHMLVTVMRSIPMY